MSLIVQKFGGSSVRNAERLRSVAEIIAETYCAGNDLIVVLSAQGDMTDELIAKASEIHHRPSKREMDMLLATGEQISVALCAMALEKMEIPCVSLAAWQVGIWTNEVHGDARIQKIDSQRISTELERRHVVLITGFQGVDQKGDITTLGRGGSDTSAVALAAAFHADLCQIYTDVEGVFTADPRVVPTARKLEEITYDEMLELAAQGANVLHHRSVELAKKYGVNLEVLSSMERVTGTKVREKTDEERLIAGVALNTDIACVEMRGSHLVPQAVSEIAALMNQNQIPVEALHWKKDQADVGEICFLVSKQDAEEVDAILRQRQAELQFESVITDEKVGKVSAVGLHLLSECGSAAVVLKALFQENIPIRAIDAAELRFSVFVDEENVAKAARGIHDAFFEETET